MILEDEKIASIFKALSDINRIKIINTLKEEEKCACKLLEELNISQPTLSHHMKILCDSGIIVSKKTGKWIHYKLNEEKFNEVSELFK